jgi:hypothetical protein
VRQRHHRLAFAGGTLFLLSLTTAVLVGWLAPSHRKPHPRTAAPASPTFPVLAPPRPAQWLPVSPATVVPEETAVQQQYDQALAEGLAGSSTVQAAESAPVPGPAVSAVWPPLPMTDSPEQWVQQFVTRLLDINFQQQPRAALGAWLSAQEAPELLPGVPAAVQNKLLYLSLLDPAVVGGGTTPIPDTETWAANARAGIGWEVSGLLIEPDRQWTQIVAAGWQPRDERFGVEDVSGQLTVKSSGRGSFSRRFSMAVYTGSAHWHPGYGTVLVDNWMEG